MRRMVATWSSGQFLVQCLLSAMLCPVVSAQVNVVTHHYDNSRTGANVNETTLTTSSVSVNSFGKLFSIPVDGAIFAQPLYVNGLTVNGASHSVVYVATAANSLYAFDADNGSLLWHINYGAPPQQSDLEIDPDIIGPIGIIGTPVIDLSTGTLYFVERNKNTDNTYHQYLRAVDLTTGIDKFGGPQEIIATYRGLAFDPKIQNQRAALTLVNGTVYIPWASHNDLGDYHGWVIGYQASNVTAQQFVYSSTTAASSLGGVWMSGQGLVADSSNNLYLMTGNGLFDGTVNFGDSFLKLSSSLGLLDYFSPSNQATLASQDTDLGSSGPLLVPGTANLLGGGKDGRFFLINTANMGKNNSSTDQVLQEFQAANGQIHGGPVYWNTPNNGPTVYVWSESDHGKAFTYSNGLFRTGPSSMTSETTPGGGSATLTISANGSTSGSGVLWANVPNGNANGGTVTGVLRAYDATNLGTELWNSVQNPSRDDYGNFGKFCPPVVVNGKVYLATLSNQLVVYGVVGSTLPSTPKNLVATAGNGQAVLSWSAASGATSYDLYRSTTAGGEGATPVATGIVSTSYTNTGLTNGTTYYFTLAAVNASGASAQSNEASVTPVAPPPPPTPTNLSATAGNAQATLSWSAASGATSYNLYRSTTAGGEGATPVATGIVSTSYTNTGLTNGTTYFFTVAAVNGFGTSGQSNEVSATPTAPPPPTGSDFSLSAFPASLSIRQSSSGRSTTTVLPVSGFKGTVSLSASGLPSGVTASFNPSSTASTSTLTLTVSRSTTTGTSTVTITGLSGSLTHTANVTLTVRRRRH
jgi:outer membrane protein assembly factor BamB